MEQIKTILKHMISISDDEMDGFLKDCYIKKYKRKDLLFEPNVVPNDVFFINQGLLRVLITDMKGVENTTHFALENQFICDYAGFIQQTQSPYALQALEDTEVVVMPRSAIEWGYQNLAEGEKLGRLVAEYYFIYLDNRIVNLYTKSPKERYDSITNVFPNIHNRVPQHMIASYLGITSVHLSRLKREAFENI